MPRHCAALKDRVALLTEGAPNVVYISSTDLQSWTETELPYQAMSLAIYQSMFVAVGGWDPCTDEATNTILTSTTGRQWEPSLPPMPTKRYRTSSVSTTSPEVLVVAGGQGSDYKKLNIVEVLITGQWITIDPLPAPASDMVSTVHEGNLYFITRYGDSPKTITTCSCTSFISSCTDSNHTSSIDSPLWSQFQVPSGHQSLVSYSSKLIIIDDRGTARGYSSTTQSWVEASIAGDAPDYYAYSTATVLPTGEICYCHGGGGVYRGTISGEICTLIQLVNMYIYIDSLHLCMCCVFDMHILYMCRYACTCSVKYTHVYVCIYVCMYVCVYIYMYYVYACTYVV